MGIVPLSLDMLRAHVGVIGGLPGRKMMELGDQQMYANPDITEASPAKEWFLRQGVAEHVSIDANGLLGALPMDLSKPIDKPEWNGAFDLVTDFGTSEHVGKDLECLYNCRSNCHRWCRVGGLMIFMNPKTGHWPLHGYHYFTLAHYEALGAACQYRVLEVSEHPTLGNFTTGWQIHAAFVKTVDIPFITFSQYSDICRHTVFPV